MQQDIFIFAEDYAGDDGDYRPSNANEQEEDKGVKQDEPQKKGKIQAKLYYYNPWNLHSVLYMAGIWEK